MWNKADIRAVLLSYETAPAPFHVMTLLKAIEVQRK